MGIFLSGVSGLDIHTMKVLVSILSVISAAPISSLTEIKAQYGTDSMVYQDPCAATIQIVSAAADAMPSFDDENYPAYPTFVYAVVSGITDFQTTVDTLHNFWDTADCQSKLLVFTGTTEHVQLNLLAELGTLGVVPDSVARMIDPEELDKWNSCLIGEDLKDDSNCFESFYGDLSIDYPHQVQ